MTWRRRCGSTGCKHSVIYPGTHCPTCGTPTVPWEEPEPRYPPMVPPPGPRRAPALDVPPLREIRPVRRLQTFRAVDDNPPRRAPVTIAA